MSLKGFTSFLMSIVLVFPSGINNCVISELELAIFCPSVVGIVFMASILPVRKAASAVGVLFIIRTFSLFI